MRSTPMCCRAGAQDMALTLELLRRVNNALRQQEYHQGETILNIQRALQMIRLDGLHAAIPTHQKPWPGVFAAAKRPGGSRP